MSIIYYLPEYRGQATVLQTQKDNNMVNNIIDGKALANEILADLKLEIQGFKEKTKTSPKLAIVLVGDNPASMIYVKNKIKNAHQVGIDTLLVNLSTNIYTDDLILKINELNLDKGISGIIVQLPLPSSIDENKILSAVLPSKDSDGFHPLNVGYLHSGINQGFIPCTALGCLAVIKKYAPNLNGKDAVIVGRSNIVGKPLSALLLQENCSVTICHSKTCNLSSITSKADIVVVAIGSPLKLTAEYFNPEAIVIDVGINRISHNKIAGDVDFENVKSKVKYITPVPGGIGPMTIAFLLKNTVKAFKNAIAL
ncbi:bifunctional 5,10-methylene-tetrahydrofolate dehydrogenase/ 5,10-methylene-tetrahydrofolate cyclohydrolase [Rickettsia prowazekii str. GvV257]|nr:Methylene tetrahydrofolate dehydrogenase [Rickettsia prowazekii str. Rp22]AFE49321.1 bifunctional 5,10-methylene-tetrahydrofolate dehydrogenase/ 5,10-methylene-tetrahydrofolate cyclohydrolase [Rickettsia prowazekii str. Chernikova]AFE50166.1 bifunctional 5,10-methylene-tetrahydrofolate dehydrogenase/ 5,10-methylene-tetrahydrofolate cyclohydrolase [Rickettsia prowazekii str. Katsinyian]AFE51012.1 bifunctional 5,10-methylene-tetrahydrofolate dehydrogenase/ 5,10-methylene-tetrahydrofolate cycloh